jgi:hypothetical protein
MAGLVLTFEKQARAIKAVGDLASGWQSYKDGYGFFGLGFMDFAGDVRVRVTVQVYTRPNRIAQVMTAFPKNLNSRGGTDSLYYDLNGSRLEVFADISKNTIWLDGAKKPGVNWRPDTPIATLGPWRFYLKLLIVFTAPSPHYSHI